VSEIPGRAWLPVFGYGSHVSLVVINSEVNNA
jgi:hypothetical protein